MKKISLKICGITNSQSVKTAHINKIKSLGFASNNLKGPNTATDKKIQLLIKECKNYKIESVLLTRYISLNKLIEQIDYTKPKTISCSYHFNKNELDIVKKTLCLSGGRLMNTSVNYSWPASRDRVECNPAALHGDCYSSGFKEKFLLTMRQ
jgi:phosphoribosylanthranilate isomerase